MKRPSIAIGLGAVALVYGSICLIAEPASAAAIEYTLSGQGPYQIQGTNYNGSFTFSWTGDTSNVSTSGGESRIYNLPGTIDLPSASYTRSFLYPTQIVLDPVNGFAYGFKKPACRRTVVMTPSSSLPILLLNRLRSIKLSA